MDTATKKRGGRRLHSALSDRAVKAATAPGRMFDGNGLFLLVTERGPNVSKVWKQRIMVNGHRQELGLGRYPVVTLAKARDKALANLRTVDDGLNPKVERRRARGIPTFAELARADFEHRKAGWRNAKHAAQWIGTLEEFAFPRLGERTVDDITTDDVFRVLSPIWHTKPTTAKRLRQRIGAVLAVAVAKGIAPTIRPIRSRRCSRSINRSRRRGIARSPMATWPAHWRNLAIGDDEALDEIGARIPGADRGPPRRGPIRDVERNRHGRGDLDGTRQANEGRTRAPRTALAACVGNPRRSVRTPHRSHQPDIPRTRR